MALRKLPALSFGSLFASVVAIVLMGTTPSLAGVSFTCAAPGGASACDSADYISEFVGGLIGITSGNAVSGAVESGTGGSGPSGPTEPLAYAPMPPSPTEAFAQFNDPAESAPGARLSVWADVSGTGWDGDNLEGGQVNGTAGLGYMVAPGLVVGVLAGGEAFDYDVDFLGGAGVPGNLSGEGGTGGGYFSWQFAPNWRLVGVAAGSILSYDVAMSGGLGDGSFDATRVLGSLSATGRYHVGSFVAEPSARIFAMWEDRDAWTDNTATPHPAVDLTAGRASAGGRVYYPMMSPSGTFSPFVGLFGDYRFASDPSFVVAGQPESEGASLRVNGGFSAETLSGTRLALEGEVGGIGSDYTEYGGKARLAVPF